MISFRWSGSLSTQSSFMITASVLALCACGSPDARSSSASSSTSTVTQVSTTSTAAMLPPTVGSGLAPLEIPPAAVVPADGGHSHGKWCTDFGDRQLSLGDTVTMVWPDAVTRSPSVVAVVSKVRQNSICVHYGQDPDDSVGEEGDEAYEITPLTPIPDGDSRNARPGIVVWGAVRWVRGPDHFLRADLDGDGNPEIARSCNTREGVIMTVSTSIKDPATGTPREVRRWKAYRPLGFDDVPNCTDRETVDDPA